MSKDRLDSDERAARSVRLTLDHAGITAVTVVGPAGSGKTSLIETLLLRLAPPYRSALIMANQAADRQISRITRHGYPGVAVKTDSITAVNVQDALRQLDLHALDVIFIEADGNAIRPANFDLGHHYRVGVFSAVGGDDKVNEFPTLVAGSNLAVLTKIDLLPFVKFDLKVFAEDIERIKPNLPLMRLSVQSGEGLDDLLNWVHARVSERIASRGGRMFDPFIDCSTSDGS